ncbi:sugar phosphate isomerase/epimerase family protein [Sphingobium estronivorans]|uniref:sugar phosphate isomerase/epimerase family protein n=1 Tax=Sphingobium estronivorans TaxID=1577690 RepID=UPI00123C756F|nr:TIM barrel protein [Sphingobium estronivorans]
MNDLSLDCLTLPDIGSADLFRIAAEAGYHSASLWVQEPALYPVMLATPAMHGEIARAMADCGVSLGNLEVFNLNIDGPIADYEPALTFGASLGARTATAINFGVPRPDIVERLAAFHALCAKHGLETLVEPISMGVTRTLQDGVDLIEAAGVNAQLVVDCLHLIRTGGSPQTLAAIAPHHVGYVQICDGPLVIAPDEIGPESVANRLYPGEGEFPLTGILGVLPPHVRLGVETPNQARLQRKLSPLERAREAFSATLALLGEKAQ